MAMSTWGELDLNKFKFGVRTEITGFLRAVCLLIAARTDVGLCLKQAEFKWNKFNSTFRSTIAPSSGD